MTAEAAADGDDKLLPCDFVRMKEEQNKVVYDDASKRFDGLVEAYDNLAATGLTGDALMEAVFSRLNDDRQQHIHSLAEMLDVSFLSLMKKIVEETATPLDLAKAVAMKAVSRTGWQEEYQYSLLSGHSRLISNLELLPKRTTKQGTAKWLVDGRVVTKKPKEGKSLDFCGKVGDIDVVIAAKYTKEHGGGQDNQANELHSFGERAGAIGDEPLVVLLADGPYFDDGWREKETRYFQSQGKNVIVTDSAHIDLAIASWAQENDIDVPDVDKAAIIPTDFPAAERKKANDVRQEFEAWHAEMVTLAKAKGDDNGKWPSLLAQIKSARGKSSKARKDNDKSRYKRIMTAASELGMQPEELLRAMIEGDGSRSRLFSVVALKKAAHRTGWQEKNQITTICDFSETVTLPRKAMPKKGKNARYLVDGQVVSTRPIGCKSIDSMGSLTGASDIPVIVAAKYTEEGGGGQDNQYADLRNFGKNAPSLGVDASLVVLLVDGDYYTSPQNGGTSRIEDMRQEFSDRNVVVTDCAHLDQEVRAWYRRASKTSSK